MKSTNTISDLISELSILGIANNNESIIESKHGSISSLIALFEEAKQDESKGLAEWLLNAAGYGWIVRLDADQIIAISELCDFTKDELFSIPETPLSQTPAPYSEADFMNLIPVNAYFH